MLSTRISAEWARPARCFTFFSVLILTVFAAAAAKPKAAPKPTNDDCLACHGDQTLTHDVNGKAVSLFVDPAKFKDSIHGSMFQCVDCHTDLKTSPHETTPAKVSCATCHADEQAAYDRSFHAKAIKDGDAHAATCVNCHGSPHELLPASDPKSRVSHVNIPATCGTCHGQKFVMEASGHSDQPFVSYQHRLPWNSRNPGSWRSEIIDFQVQRSPHLCEVSLPGREGVCREHSRASHRSRQLDGPGLHRLSRHSLHQVAHRSQFAGFCTEPGPGYLCSLS